MSAADQQELTTEQGARSSTSPRRRRSVLLRKKTWDFSNGDPQEKRDGSGSDTVFSGTKLQRGDTIGLYRIESALGSGGMGRVFKAEHTVTGAIQALKVVLREGPGGAERAKRFHQEVRTQASMKHAGVPAVYNAFWEGNALAMAMEMIEGQSLERLLKDRPVPLSEGLGYVMQVLDVLDHVHAKDVVHRDVSPANIMVGWDGKVRLTDFGLARVITNERPGETGVVVGSVYYMSPEQVRGDASIDHRTDIYSLGVVLYELVTGKRPFEGDNHYSVMRAHVEQEPAKPSEVNPRIPPSLSLAICTALAKQPGQRFQSAKAFREALDASSPEIREGSWTRASRWGSISGAIQKLRPPSAPLGRNDSQPAHLAAPGKDAGPETLPPALRGFASSLSCLSKRESDKR